MKRLSFGDKMVNVVFYAILTLLVIICFYPVWYAFLASFSDATYINSGALILVPRGIQFAAYRICVCAAAAVVGLCQHDPVYGVRHPLSAWRSACRAAMRCRGRICRFAGSIMVVFAFTMYFGGGLIPTYIVCSKLHLVNTRWILILLGSVSVYNIILIRTFCGSTIPNELREAAVVDGCSNSRFFFTFVLPLSKAIIAVVALYIAVAHWNNYYNALVYTTDTSLHPLQLYLRQLLLITMGTDSVSDPDALKEIQDMILTIRYAVIVISTLPIMCLYPFLQKYFVQGVMIGSLKG